MLAWLNGVVAGGLPSVATGSRSKLGGPPTAGRAGTPVRALGAVVVVVVVVVCRVSGPRATYLSREVWHPDPPQSWPALWLGLGRVQSVTPVFVFHFMPYS